MNNIRYIDDNILDYMKENNRLILEQFGDIAVLLHRKSSGSMVGIADVATYDDAAHLEFTLWQGNPGGTQALNHPDLRYDTNNGSGSIRVIRDGTNLSRVLFEEELLAATQYWVYTDVSGSVKVKLYASGSVQYSYDTMCHCVEPQRVQGKTNCPVCYGTLYEGGYDIDAGYASPYNPAQTILVRITPAFSDQNVESVRNEREDTQTEGWTILDDTYPQVYDSDYLYFLTGHRAGKYFMATNVKASSLRGTNLSQRFQVHSIEDSSIMYSFPIPDIDITGY